MATNISLPITAEQRRNYHYLYADIGWFGVLAGSTTAFLGIYLARIGANSLQVGLLSAGPAIINLFFSLPAGHWLENQPLIRQTFQSSVWQRLAYALLIPLPWLFAYTGQIWATVLLTLLMSIPGTVLAIAFNALFADLVPPEARAGVVGRRNAIFAIVVTLTTLAAGQILVRVNFPYNYQIIFLLGAVGALMSSYQLARLRKVGQTPPRVLRPLGDLAWPGTPRFIDSLRHPPMLRLLTRSHGQSLLRLDLLRGSFGVFMLAYFLFYTFQYVPLPLFPLFYVNELKLSDAIISLGSAVFYIMMTLVSLRIHVLSDRIGNRWMLILGSLTFCIYPLILFFAHGADLFWLASLVGGVVWAILNTGLVNRLMERVPEHDRPAHMAIHNLALNLGILLGSLMGPLFTGWLGLREMMLVGAGVRFLGGVLLWIWG
jgi:MFS family permease